MAPRAIVVLALVGALAFVASAYEVEKQYRYDFDGVISSKVGDNGDEQAQSSGVAIRSSLLVSKRSDDIMIVQLLSPKIATFNQASFAGAGNSANDIDDELDEGAKANSWSETMRLKLDDQSYKPMEGDDGSALRQPFRIHFGPEGQIKSMDIYKEGEPKWVSNFKRGLLSFFQLRLSPESGDQSSAQSAQLDERSYSVAERSVFGECETEYTVMDGERTYKGAYVKYVNVTKSRNMAKCKSAFSLALTSLDTTECGDHQASDRFGHSNAVYNYNLRGDRSNYVIERVIMSEQQRSSPFGPNGHIQIVVNKFVMQLSPNQPESSELTVDTGRVVKSDSLAYEPPEMINFYANVNLSEAHYLYNIYDQQAVSVEQVQLILDDLVTAHKDYHRYADQRQQQQQQQQQGQPIQVLSTELGAKFERLVELMGLLDFAKIDQLYYNVDSASEQHKKLFFDAIGSVGTNPSIMFMKRLIMDGDAPSSRVKDFLSRFSFHIRVPTKNLFDEYVALCRSDKIQANLANKRQCLLPLASLIHQHCVKPHVKYLRAQVGGVNATQYRKAQNACQLATGEEYFQQLVSAQASAEAEAIGDKMLLVKLAGALGVRPTIDYLYQNYIRARSTSSPKSAAAQSQTGQVGGQQQQVAQNSASKNNNNNKETQQQQPVHPALRTAAVWQLAPVAKFYPQQAKRIVTPLYYDRDECLEVRLAAFNVWLSSGSMSLHELETVAEQLLTEPDRQLVTYMYSLLESSSRLNANIPCLHSFDRYAQQVLPTVRRALHKHTQQVQWADSYVSISTTWQPDYHYGTKQVMSKIACNESFSPAHLHYSTSEFMRGIRITPKRIDVQLHGLDKLLLRVFGITGMSADKDSLLDLFSLKRRTRAASSPADLVKQEVADLDKELKMSVRDFGDVYLALTISAFGRPITFVDIDSKQLKRMASDDGTIRIPNIRKLMSAFTNHTMQQLDVPLDRLELAHNELGLPTYKHMSLFEYHSFKMASVKLDAEPGFFRDERAGKPPTRLAASLDARIVRHQEFHTSSGLLLTSQRQRLGAGMYRQKLVNVPLKISFDVNWNEQKVALKSWPIVANGLYIKQGPFTYNYTYNPNVRAIADARNSLDVYTLDDEQVGTSTRHEYMTPLAVGVRVDAKHRRDSDWSRGAWLRYARQVAQNGAGLAHAKFAYFYSPTGEPMEMTLSTTTTDVNPTEESSTVFTWRHHRHDDSPAVAASSEELDEHDKQVNELLESFTKDDQRAPPTVTYKLMKLGGTTKQRKVSFDIHYSRSIDRTKHKWMVFYERTPLEQQQQQAAPSDGQSAYTDATNLCWSGQVQYPRYPIGKLLEANEQLLTMDHWANLTTQFLFGSSCQQTTIAGNSGDSYFKANARFDWSADQRAAFNSIIGAKSSLMNVTKDNRELRSLYAKCQQARNKLQMPLHSACIDLVRKATELAHAEATFNYANVPERWSRMASMVSTLYTYARAGYIAEMSDRDHTDAVGARTGPAPGEARLEANMTFSGVSGASKHKLNYRLDTPNKVVSYANVPLTVPVVSTFPLFDASYYSSGAKSVMLTQRSCLVGGKAVNTFDNQTFMLPALADGCFKVLAKDCSPENNFIVLGAKVVVGKVMKVYIGQQYKVQFVPNKETGAVSEIKINDVAVKLPDSISESKSYTQSMPIASSSTNDNKNKDAEAFTISYNGAFYTLDSSRYKFSASTDGTWIRVSASRYYSGRTCGICGDNNGEIVHEFTTAERNLALTSDEFVMSYVLPSTCPTATVV